MSIAILNGSECYVPFSCLDVSGSPFTPTSISYQVWNNTNPNNPIQVVPSTPVSPAQSGTITLDSTTNTMNTLSPALENRVVTVKVGIPGGSFENLTATYSLIRAPGTP